MGSGRFEDLVQQGGSPPTMWLTSFWGFAPEQWGCIGFTNPAMRADFIEATAPGVLVAIYVTKHRGTKDERGKLLGFLEISDETGHAEQFISGDLWARNQEDRDARGKWLHALRATRAWRVIPEQWQRVDDLLPKTYAGTHPLRIGGAGVTIDPEEVRNLLRLEVEETSVFGAYWPVDPSLMPLQLALTPSRAVPTASAPYWVGETDGPKHLYILKLAGDAAAYLGRPAAALEAEPIPSPAPHANADVATAGENAMKARLEREKAECLGGEFFLVPDWLIPHVWRSGRVAAEAAASGGA